MCPLFVEDAESDMTGAALTLKANYRGINVKPSDAPVCILTVYDESGMKLMGLKLQNISTGDNNIVMFEGLDKGDAYTFNALLWENFSTVKPVSGLEILKGSVDKYGFVTIE